MFGVASTVVRHICPDYYIRCLRNSSSFSIKIVLKSCFPSLPRRPLLPCLNNLSSFSFCSAASNTVNAASSSSSSPYASPPPPGSFCNSLLGFFSSTTFLLGPFSDSKKKIDFLVDSKRKKKCSFLVRCKCGRGGCDGGIHIWKEESHPSCSLVCTLLPLPAFAILFFILQFYGLWAL